jgi:hypothetical protein
MARSQAPRPISTVSHAVRFIRTWQSYMPGDVATFPGPISRRLVAAGRAERVNLAIEDENNPAPEGAEWATRMPQAPPYRQGSGPDDDLA